MSTAERVWPFFSLSLENIRPLLPFFRSMEALCFSQHLFPLLPFIIATQGDRAGTQILLGPLEWVSCGDWNHGEQGAGMIMRAAASGRFSSTAELSCSLVKEMKQQLRRRNKFPVSAWNLLLSDSSALETLKVKRNNSCSKKDLLECAELHSPETQHQNHSAPIGREKGQLLQACFPLQKGEGRGGEPMKLLLPVPHLTSMVKLQWWKACALQIVFYYNYCRVISTWTF